MIRAVSMLVRAVLRLAPPSFRDSVGTEYIEVVEERMTDARWKGRWPATKLAVREGLGAMRTVITLRTGRRRTRTGGDGMLRSVLQDTTQAARALRRNPGFTMAAVVVLALGIGATTAIFSAVNAYFFRPLPFEEADRLVLLYETNPEFGWIDANAAPANVMDWRERVDAFEDIAMFRDFGVGDVTIQTDGDPVLVGGTSVTGNFFDVLGVQPALGRGFRFEETWRGQDQVIVLSHALWVSHFGADPGVVGMTIPFGGAGEPHEIIGVMPEGFAFPDDRTQLWYTYAWDDPSLAATHFRRAHFVRPVARLAHGVSLEEADAQLQAVVASLQEEYPGTNAIMGAGMTPIRDFLVRGVRTPLMVLLGAVTILLLLACSNVANLMLVRANDRTREVALRNALGARRSRVARQFLTESLLIGLVGGAIGLVLGWIGVEGMATMTRLGISGATDLALDARVVAFTLSVAVFSGVLFGTFPALRSAGGDIQGALRDGGRGQSGGVRGMRAVGLLVTAEVALALLLVVGAGLMIRSGMMLRNVDPGFRVDGALAIELSVPSARYAERDDVLGFWDEFQRLLEGRPGIERAGMVGLPPLGGTSWSSQFQAEDWPDDRYGSEIIHRRADAGYFEALDIPLVRGRLFGPTDGPEAPLVVVVNETFARQFFPDEDPIGQRIAYDRNATPESYWYEIVGIVGDQHQEKLGEPARPEVFENRNQDWGRDGWIVMKTSVDPVSVVPAVREVLRELDPQIPLATVRPMRDFWRTSMDRERFILVLLSIFGATALLLATVGVYGVTAQAMRRRTQEIGIRMALGAAARDVVMLVLRQGAILVALGIGIGLVASLFATRALASLLYGVAPTDPTTLASVVALLGGVALVACYVPARRATAVDPVRSLSAE